MLISTRIGISAVLSGVSGPYDSSLRMKRWKISLAGPTGRTQPSPMSRGGCRLRLLLTGLNDGNRRSDMRRALPRASARRGNSVKVIEYPGITIYNVGSLCIIAACVSPV